MKLSNDSYCIHINSTIRQAMEVINKNFTGTVLVQNNQKQIIGIIADGDIRRALLKGYQLKDSIEWIYNKNFKYVNCYKTKNKIKECMLKHKIRLMPILDKENRLIDIYFIYDMLSLAYDTENNHVFIPEQ